MTATTTTIKGVSILTRKRNRHVDVFDITLSLEGIDVQRPGRPPQHMGWDRISRWDIEERANGVILTLRGDGAVTPLVVKGWTLDDLEVVMRQVTAGAPRTEPTPPAVPAIPVAAAAPREPELVTTHERPRHDAARPAPRAKRWRPGRAARVTRTWKAVVTVGLLCVLATAVILVLLQSAGVISWSFLGPTA